MRLIFITPSGPVVLYDDESPDPSAASVSGNTLRTVEAELIEPGDLWDL